MSEDTRRRGRPVGSGKNDTPLLSKAADLIVSEPSMKPTTAMRAAMRIRSDSTVTDETLLRRLQGKWKTQGDQLLAEAGERARARSSSSVGYSSTYAGSPLRSTAAEIVTRMFEDQQRLQDLIDPPGSRHVREIMERDQRMQDLIDPPGSRAIRKVIEDAERWRKLLDPFVRSGF